MQIAKRIGILLVALTLCGCSSAVTRVSIPVKVQSEIDITRYSNFAVLPFVSEKQVERNQKLPPEVGEEIASILRRGLARQKHFEVVSTQETARLLTGETIGEDWLSDTKQLSELGDYFEVKAVIIGSFRFYSDSRPRRYYGETLLCTTTTLCPRLSGLHAEDLFALASCDDC